MPADTGHRVTAEWMGSTIDTLADLFPPAPRAVCVGINPAPVSVAAGHYYQGRQGQRFFSRLRQAGVLTGAAPYEDDLAFRQGIGFTDVVKRPTPSAESVAAEEMRFGAEELREKLTGAGPPVLIFPFKAAAVALVGRFEGNGWLHERDFAGARLFVMPGPYEHVRTAGATIATLLDGLA